MMSSEGPLRTAGRSITTADGAPVLLRGVCLGGGLNMENYATGFPATETLGREAMRRALGEEGYRRFFDRFLDVYYGEEDAALLAAHDMNCVRVPINYRHFEDDMQPFELKEEGFRLLDRVIERGARHGVYTMIDLHALPGYQNQMWHCNNPTHWASFWEHKHFQDRVVHLWEALAERYRGNHWVAGYNPINEPADPSGELIGPYYERLHDAIRAIDPDHILFLDGNRYSVDFQMFETTWPNTVWCAHDYGLPGFVDGGDYPGVSRGEFVDRDVLEQGFLQRTEFMRETETPIFIGEFGPSYTGDAARDAMRYQMLRDQLEIYDRHQAGWVIWLYKDIGLQGLAYAAPDSPYVQRVQPVVEKKARLGVDAWGTTDAGVRHILEPIERTFDADFPGFDPFPFGRRDWIATLVRHILLAEPLLEDFARCFDGLTPDEAEALANAFQLDRCVLRTELLETLKRAASKPPVGQ
jgi:endoglucanase